MTKKSGVNDADSKSIDEKPKRLTCGLIMPISTIDGCPAEHWLEVKNIIIDAVDSIEDLDFEVRLVSDQDDVGVIQKRIVQNVYNSDIVVCDVSCKNPNVMFELGMRLAFDKPTVIVKDDKTDYSFDTGVIEHIPYPRDLRFSKMVSFKASLADKVAATYHASLNDPNHSTFLKNFGTFRIAGLEQKELTEGQMLLEMMVDLSARVESIRRDTRSTRTYAGVPSSKKALTSATAGIVRRVVKSYMDDNSITPGELLQLRGREDFCSTISQLLDPELRFESDSHLRAVIDDVIFDIVL